MESTSKIGLKVAYRDILRLEHQGVIVDEDSEWAYVRSSSETFKDDGKEWHFRVRLDAIQTMIVTDESNRDV